VDEADPDRLAGVAEALVETERVPRVVRPDPDLRAGQPRGHVLGGHAVHVDQERGHAAVHPGPPVDGDRVGQAVEEALAERALVGDDRGETPDRVEVVDGRVEPGEQLVRLRAGLEAAAQRAGRRRARLVRPPLPGHLGPAVSDAEVRAAELVRRADQHVGADGPDIDRLVRRVVDGVHPGQRPGVVREPAHAAGVGDRADRVRRPGERDHLGARPQLGLQVREVERRVVVQRDVPDHQAAVVRDFQPRRHPCVVVQAGHQDLVAGPQGARGGPRQREVQRGHVRAEDHLVRVAAEEPGRLVLGLLEDLPDPDAGGVACAQVRAGLPQRPRDRVAHLVGDLGAAGGVEEGESLPQRGEAGPDGRDVHPRVPVFAGTKVFASIKVLASTEQFGHRKLPPRGETPPLLISTSQLPARSHISPLALA
jgi:hypothetical protein